MKDDLSLIKELAHVGEDENYSKFRKWLNEYSDGHSEKESDNNKLNKEETKR